MDQLRSQEGTQLYSVPGELMKPSKEQISYTLALVVVKDSGFSLPYNNHPEGLLSRYYMYCDFSYVMNALY